MPEIRDDEISLATCLAARWSVSVSCGPCRCLKPVQLENLTRHRRFGRPLVWLAKDRRPLFRCAACKSPSTGIFVSRPGDGPVFKVDLIGD